MGTIRAGSPLLAMFAPFTLATSSHPRVVAVVLLFLHCFILFFHLYPRTPRVQIKSSWTSESRARVPTTFIQLHICTCGELFPLLLTFSRCASFLPLLRLQPYAMIFLLYQILPAHAYVFPTMYICIIYADAFYYYILRIPLMRQTILGNDRVTR